MPSLLHFYFYFFATITHQSCIIFLGGEKNKTEWSRGCQPAELPYFRGSVEAAVTCMVTGAVLCLIELGVGSTLLIPSSLCGSTLFNAGSHFSPRTNESPAAFWAGWKLNTFSVTAENKVADIWGRQEADQEHFVSSWFSCWEANRVERFLFFFFGIFFFLSSSPPPGRRNVALVAN